jgi:cyclopropane fatty-acyl-phospholipid synthase-like methyltransferase
MQAYWKDVWNAVEPAAPDQVQVMRTVNKKPVEDDVFLRTVDFVEKQMGLNGKSDLLELCCGNGAMTIPLAHRVNSVLAVDFSEPLIHRLQERSRKEDLFNIKTLTMNVADLSTDILTPFSHILLYYAFQYFEESDAVYLFEKAHSWLLPGGIFYIGEIPDREKLWTFANTPEYEKSYFDLLKNGKPAIGTWYEKTFLHKLADWAHFSRCEIIKQPSWQINSGYRFDIKLVK